VFSSSYADLFTPTFCIVTMRQDYNFKMIQLNVNLLIFSLIVSQDRR